MLNLKTAVPSASRKPLASAIALASLIALTGTIVPIAAHAQQSAGGASQSANSQTQTVNIPAGSLSQVLSQFAGAVGVALSFDASQFNSIRSPGLRGSYSIEQGFAVLLAETEAIAVRQGNGDYVLESSGAMTLPPVKVNAEAARNSTLISLDKPAQIGKLGLSLHETPASISLINKKFIQDTGAKNLDEALLYSPGVHSGNSGFSTRADWITVRGVDDLVVYRDGLRTYSGDSGPRTNIYSLDHVEVLKGPSSALYGQGGLGGLLNTASKLPKEQAQHEIWAQAGNYDRLQLAADSTGPLTSDSKWLYRVVALQRESDTQVEHVNDDGYFVAPSLTWQPTDKTALTLLVHHQEKDSKMGEQFLPAKGTIDPAPRGRIPTDTFVGEPDWDRHDTEKTEVTLFFEHAISDTWRVSTKARQSDSSLSFRSHRTPFFGGDTQPDDDGNIDRMVRTLDIDTDFFNLDARLDGSFDLGSSHHNVVVGADYLDALTELDNFFIGFGLGGSFNLYDPVYGNINEDVVEPFDLNDSEIKQTGFYIADHITVNKFSVSIALRRDDYENTQLNISGSDTVSKGDEITGHIGFMYQFNNGISPYISYAESFSPNLGTDGTAESNILKPTTGNQEEVGIKYLSPEGDLEATWAYYEIEQENRISDGITSGGVTQIGAEIQGWELEVKKSWQNLEVQAGYTDLDASNKAANTRVPHMPEKLASLWAQYDLPMGLRLGAGIRYKGDIVGAGDGPLLPSVTLYDASIGYSFEQWNFSVEGKNITDNIYIARCRKEGEDCYYGDRRTVIANIRYSF